MSDRAEEKARLLASRLTGAGLTVTLTARGADGLWRVWVGYFVSRSQVTDPVVVYADGSGADVQVRRNAEAVRAIVAEVFPPPAPRPPPPPATLPLVGAPDVAYLVDLEGLARQAVSIAFTRALGERDGDLDAVAASAVRAVWERVADVLADRQPAYLAASLNHGPGWRRVTQPQKKGAALVVAGPRSEVLDDVAERLDSLCAAHAIPVLVDSEGDEEGIDLLAGAARALVGCSKKKRPGRHPARELYAASSLFTMALRYAEATCDRVFVLSAKHGLVKLDEALDAYDHRLTFSGSHPWALDVVAALKPEIPEGRTPQLVIFAGAAYADPFLTFRPPGWPVPERPLAGLQTGPRRAWLSERIAQLAAAPSAPEAAPEPR